MHCFSEKSNLKGEKFYSFLPVRSCFFSDLQL